MPFRGRLGSIVVGVVLLLLPAGCGSDHAAPDQPSKATRACRGEWKDLGTQVRGNDEKTNPSALAPRWTTVVATIDYYASSAKASGCQETIDRQKAAIAALTAFGGRLAPYDMELRLEQVRAAAEKYAAGPRPTPTPAPRGGKKNAKKPMPPAPPTIAAAVKTLVAQAPKATEQQGPGWSQARVVELSDKAAVAKSLKDLAFLSSQSPAWRACRAALAQIQLALAASK